MTIDACAALVEAGDPDRFAATMAAPVAARARLWPLYAYNLEIARAPWASTEPMIAEMRLQWWIDTVEAMGKGVSRPGHDVTKALAPLVGEVPELTALLAGMAEARRWEVWKDPFTDATDLADHIQKTAGHLMWAAALALGAPPTAEAPVRDFAYAAGLAAWLRAVPALTGHGRQPLPDLSPEAIAHLAREGLQAIGRAQAQRKLVPGTISPALWSGWQARRILSMAVREPEHVLAGALHVPEAARRLGLLWLGFTGRW